MALPAVITILACSVAWSPIATEATTVQVTKYYPAKRPTDASFDTAMTDEAVTGK